MGSSNARSLRVFVAALLCLAAFAALYGLGGGLIEVVTLGFVPEYDAVIVLRAFELASFVVLAVAVARGSLGLIGAGGALLLASQLVALGVSAMQTTLLGASFEMAFYLERILTLAGALLLVVGASFGKAKAARVAAMILFWFVLITNSVYEMSWLPEYIYMADFTVETIMNCLVTISRDLFAPLGMVLLSAWAIAQGDGSSGSGSQSPTDSNVFMHSNGLPVASALDMERCARLLDGGALSKEEFESIRSRYLAL